MRVSFSPASDRDPVECDEVRLEDGSYLCGQDGGTIELSRESGPFDTQSDTFEVERAGSVKLTYGSGSTQICDEVYGVGNYRTTCEMDRGSPKTITSDITRIRPI